jgi:purine-binding chemotaxis protein CheW
MADKIENTGSTIMQVVCFKLADEEYAFDITRVQEVIRLQPITEVPQMPDFVLGVVNIRGSVVPVFDLRKKFHLPEKKADDHTKILVVSVDNELISFIVDEILDNLKLDSAQLDPAPAIKMSLEKECVLGVGLVDDRMISVLDISYVNKGINAAIEASI